MINIPKKEMYKYCLNNDLILPDGKIKDIKEWINELTLHEQCDAIIKNPQIMKYIEHPSYDLITLFMDQYPCNIDYINSDNVIVNLHKKQIKNENAKFNYSFTRQLLCLLTIGLLFLICFASILLPIVIIIMYK